MLIRIKHGILYLDFDISVIDKFFFILMKWKMMRIKFRFKDFFIFIFILNFLIGLKMI